MPDQTAMPGTISEEARRLRWIKVSEGHIEHQPVKVYEATTADGLLRAILTCDEVREEKLLWHISVSHRDKDGIPDRVPTWDELKSAKYQLVPEDVVMVLIFPRRTAKYVNVHDTCLHLWQDEDSLDE
jgi:hypothetical protein